MLSSSTTLIIRSLERLIAPSGLQERFNIIYIIRLKWYYLLCRLPRGWKCSRAWRRCGLEMCVYICVVDRSL